MNSNIELQNEGQTEFHQMAEAVGGIYSEANQAVSELLNGCFSYHSYFGGLSTHIGNVVELKDVSHFVELPACLSFNILFEGHVDITLGSQDYELGPVDIGIVECSAIISPKPEVLTRRLKQGMKVYKLNVFVERKWLESRISSLKDSAFINAIFGDGTKFSSWKASKKLVNLAENLIQEHQNITFLDKINAEQLTMKLLVQCISELKKNVFNAAVKNEFVSNHKVYKQALKQRVDTLIKSQHTLTELASSMHMSVSTLQRKFKNEYGMTVSHYCQQRRLEIAKKTIMRDGITISEAAYLAGYKHTSNFITAFKKRYRVTPAALVSRHE